MDDLMPEGVLKLLAAISTMIGAIGAIIGIRCKSAAAKMVSQVKSDEIKSDETAHLLESQGKLIQSLIDSDEKRRAEIHALRNDLMVLQGRLYLALRQNDWWMERVRDLMDEVNHGLTSNGEKPKYDDAVFEAWQARNNKSE